MDELLRLDGKVALVTGASSGLGERFAEVLGRAGARVALAARRVDRLASLEAKLATAGVAARAVAMDVTRLDSIRDAVAEAERAVGPIDILVNNSGVSVTKRLVDHDEADYDYVIDTNLKGAFFVAQAVAKRMIGGKRGGRIINIASAGGIRPLARIGVYCMSKAGVIHMTRAMALEWGRYGINVNAVCPGYIETEINREHWQTEAGRKLVEMLPRKRVGRPEDLDGLMLLLASQASHFINGASIVADDGLTAA
ncbi:MAG: SDR family oxidoreductase [Burkholderiales bacterium]|nr:SDR family oxidoreductase [Burkholderiales bacterium]